MPEQTKTTPELSEYGEQFMRDEMVKRTGDRVWKKFFSEYGEHKIILKNDMYPDYATTITVNRLYQMFLDRQREE